MAAYGIGSSPGADPTKTYLTNVLAGILSANSIRDVGPDEMRGIRHQVYQASVDQTLPMANRPVAAVTTFKGLETIAFAVQWLCRHNRTSNVDLVNSLIPAPAVHYWMAPSLPSFMPSRCSTSLAAILPLTCGSLLSPKAHEKLQHRPYPPRHRARLQHHRFSQIRHWMRPLPPSTEGIPSSEIFTEHATYIKTTLSSCSFT